ncbi:site-specific DNA-methyltransferase [Chryseobacterium sp. ON_d1]|uniref:site-specific DNA-methyltransferase n=1 Tax=Chryseobacterium sp. ON_d1 TaxID=2583211 RepID=UPI001156E49A|nr:site-specific DNA-methyltransferase [Chryseobacterium sp. ON_d1]GEJ47605.1 site-specific DNA-methyltransferase [Chryseobacterium sp. ON_d1]
MPTLHWIGKEKIINHHLEVPYKILEKKYSVSSKEIKDSNILSENKIIHGDNLVALKSLLPQYEGRINCIYIDPPYNTGNEEWIYNDNVNDPKIKKWLGEVVGKEEEDLTRHDKWLCMMYPRLKLLKKLLHQNGCIIISLSHHEISSLQLVCKEIFAEMQITIVTVQTSGGKPSGGFNYTHEYLIFILPQDFKPNALSFSGGNVRSPFEGMTLATFNKIQRPNQAYPIYVESKTGLLHSVGKSLAERIKDKTYVGKLEDFIYDYNEAPENCVAIWPVTSKGDDCVWRLIPSRLKNDWGKGYIKISPNQSKNNLNSYSIQYLPSGVIKKIETGELVTSESDNDTPTLNFGKNKTVGSQIPTMWMEKKFHTVNGTQLLNEIFGSKIFNYPKPLSLIEEVIRAVSNKNDIVLDSFAGSGTTAHAVLNINKEDDGNRKFILIEMENYAEAITAERVKRVINGYGKGDKAVEGTLGHYSYYTLGQTIFVENGMLNQEIELHKIYEYVWYSETKLPFEIQSENYLLGVKDETAYYFYYEKEKMTTLDESFLRTIKTKSDQYIIYADNCLLSNDLMQKYSIVFKKIPRDITKL